MLSSVVTLCRMLCPRQQLNSQIPTFFIHHPPYGSSLQPQWILIRSTAASLTSNEIEREIEMHSNVLTSGLFESAEVTYVICTREENVVRFCGLKLMVNYGSMMQKFLSYELFENFRGEVGMRLMMNYPDALGHFLRLCSLSSETQLLELATGLDKFSHTVLITTRGHEFVDDMSTNDMLFSYNLDAARKARGLRVSVPLPERQSLRFTLATLFSSPRCIFEVCGTPLENPNIVSFLANTATYR
jgi:hypothetical protein